MQVASIMIIQCRVAKMGPSLVFYTRPIEKWLSLSHNEIDQSPPSFSCYLNYEVVFLFRSSVTITFTDTLNPDHLMYRIYNNLLSILIIFSGVIT